jgi:signal transduction histidine kinase
MIRLGPYRSWRTSPPVFLRLYLFFGALVLALGLLVYFHRLARRVDAQTEAMSGLVARVIAFTTLSVADTSIAGSSTQAQFQEVLHELPFPVILTDVDRRPLTWSSHVNVPPMSIDRLLREDLDHPSPGLAPVLRQVRRMDRMHAPIPMLEPGTADTLMYLHYGAPALAGELQWTPWITIAAAALFGAVGLLMLRSLKRAQEGFIWAGMAKETAHQMGTPLSSLIGWLEVLRDEVKPSGERVELSRELFEEVVREMNLDTGRLNRVAARFSQIGSRPRLESQSVVPVVESTVAYFRRRIPEGVTLTLQVASDAMPVALNPELFGWVLENLLKNAMDAVDSKTGKVEVEVKASASQKTVNVSVRDNGKGVTPGMEEQIFRPGVSTRMRGWGLGLALSRRIVEHYHGGRLDLVRSEPGKGAEFRVTLPRAGI